MKNCLPIFYVAIFDYESFKFYSFRYLLFIEKRFLCFTIIQ
ncbi:hypothetical protein HMPREF1863_00899 [Aedoeadaptatus coxii]|uniref:Uncharacterized protein n=1 Tax=Aedoeadaptatus coxii TaxID=755172 RepID=A0A134AGK5_9FIRM|nr:hypothetical protein HMPREF1863_00899 [Peptoniphilus coxii]